MDKTPEDATLPVNANLLPTMVMFEVEAPVLTPAFKPTWPPMSTALKAPPYAMPVSVMGPPVDNTEDPEGTTKAECFAAEPVMAMPPPLEAKILEVLHM